MELDSAVMDAPISLVRWHVLSLSEFYVGALGEVFQL
jgi:hypothetical protein